MLWNRRFSFFVALLIVVLCSVIPAYGYSSSCPRDCLEIQRQANFYKISVCSGVYTIKPDSLPPFKVYCDMETDGGGWTVFQRRMDGSQNFYLYWRNYQRGFGYFNKEFWLGLDSLQRLTVSNSKLRVDMEDFSGVKKYATYSLFRVGNALTKYTVTIGSYKGTAGNSFGYHNGMKFSTRDRDNDRAARGSCARTYKGGWWYKSCHVSNLNGRYLYGPHSSYADGVNWYHFRRTYRYSLKFSEMKVRRV